MDLELRIDGARISVDGRKGAFLCTRIRALEIRRARSAPSCHPASHRGQGGGPAHDFMRYVAESPLDEWHRSCDPRRQRRAATASSRCKLELAMGSLTPTDRRRIHFVRHAHRAGRRLPAHRAPQRTAAFTDTISPRPSSYRRGARAPGAAVVSRPSTGMPVSRARAARASRQLRSAISAAGAAHARLRDHRLEASVSVAAGPRDWSVESTLKGASDRSCRRRPAKPQADALAAPASSAASDDAAHDLMHARRYGRVGTARRRAAPDRVAARAERGVLSLGTARRSCRDAGLWIRGDVDALDLDGWLIVKEQLDAGATPAAMPLTGIDVSAGALDVFGRLLSDLRIGATRTGNDWQTRPARPRARRQRALGGARRRPSQWPPPRAPSAAVAPPPAAPVNAAAGRRPGDAPPAANPWPAIDIERRDFRRAGTATSASSSSSRSRTAPTGGSTTSRSPTTTGGWTPTAGGAAARGIAADDARRRRSTCTMPASTSRASGCPTRSAAPPTQIRGQLAWAGAPAGLRLSDAQRQASTSTPGAASSPSSIPASASCSACFRCRRCKRRLDARFPGSVQRRLRVRRDHRRRAHPERRDADATICKIVGPAARVDITGEADLAQETQHLSVRVQPTLSASVSVGAAALLLANPIIGAAVGAGRCSRRRSAGSDRADVLLRVSRHGQLVGSGGRARRPMPPRRRQPRQASRIRRRR